MSLPPLDTLRRTGVVFVDETRVRIAITGDDRFTWLNGVVTCDVKPIAEDAGKSPRAAYGCVLNVKGRVLGDVVVVAGGGELSAWVPRAASAAILEHWQKYVIMEDCELALDESRRLVLIDGTEAEGGAKLDRFGLGGGVVIEAKDAAEAQSIVVGCVRRGAARLDVESAHRLMVETARATWGADLDEHAYVQEARLEDRAVSFTKGCYVGQEVVCMLQMRGKVHRRLAQLAIDAAPAVGAEVKHGGEVVGHVTSVAPHDDGTAVALAMVKSSVASGESVDVAGSKARVVTDAG